MDGFERLLRDRMREIVRELEELRLQIRAATCPSLKASLRAVFRTLLDDVSELRYELWLHRGRRAA